METEQLNIVDTIIKTINNIFSNLFSSIDNSLYSILDDLLFINTDILDNKYFKLIFGSSSNGLILICNSFLIGLIIYYSLKLLLSHITFSQVQKPSQFIFKLFLCTLLINFSGFLIQEFILFFSNFSLSIREIGENIFNKSICISSFIQEINSYIYIDSSVNFLTLEGLSKSLVSIGFLNLAISYSLRYIMINVSIFLTPFSIISLISPSTSWIFKSWFKIFLSLLFLQILVPIILMVYFSINSNTSNIFSDLICIGTIYALIKSNSFIKDFMGGLSTDINLGISNFKNLIANK